MTDLNCEERELPIDELTIEELDSVNGGRIKLPINDFVKAWKIAQLERDCPGFV
jgi:bacteriocin-like protein